MTQVSDRMVKTGQIWVMVGHVDAIRAAAPVSQMLFIVLDVENSWLTRSVRGLMYRHGRVWPTDLAISDNGIIGWRLLS